jgi:hypothetical protein
MSALFTDSEIAELKKVACFSTKRRLHHFTSMMTDFFKPASAEKQVKVAHELFNLPMLTIEECNDPDKVKDSQPDFVIIFPWNLREEISHQLSFVRDWGGKFVVAIPSLEIF